MKPFSFRNFQEYYNKFIWSHPDIEQSYWTKEDSAYDYNNNRDYRVTYTLSTIRYRGERVMQFYTNDENNKGRRLDNYKNFFDEARVTGLLSYSNWGVSAAAVIDGLYYTANPPIYFNKNGTLKKGFWGWLNRRLRSKNIRSSWVTQHMLEKAVELAKIEVDNSEDDISIINVFVSKGITSGWFNDPITDKYYVEGNESRHRVGTLGYIRIHRSTNLSEHGYVLDNRNNIWLLPTQIYHSGQVYNRSEVTLENCRTCGNEHVSSVLIDGICTNCVDSAYKIHNYSTRVEGLLKFKATKVKPTTVYLGCELEYETINRQKAQIGVGKLLQGHALMKSDGSIQNGFEIVTCPATLDIHLQVFKSFFDNLPPDLKIEKNVGMHVHISRKPLSELTLGKMTEFLNRDENKDFIHHIAGRQNNSYARMEKNRTVTFAWRHRNGSDRYNALNLNNKNTVEIRLFATPMDYKTFAMRLQFCQALVDYCQPGQSNASLKQQTHYKEFIGWMHGNRKSFPELYTHLKGIN